MKRAVVSLLFTLLLTAQDPALEHARKVNLARAAALPNFVADETATRYKSRHIDPPKWELVDKIESEISVKGPGFTRTNIRVNGKPWNKPDLPSGVRWSVAFGNELKPLFEEKCQVRIE